MRIASKTQLSLFDEPEVVAGATLSLLPPSSLTPDAGLTGSVAPTRISVFTDGAECPVPQYFPQGHCQPNHVAAKFKLIKAHDWRGLRALNLHWYCLSCKRWHNFTERFFREFAGIYPHQWKNTSSLIYEKRSFM